MRMFLSLGMANLMGKMMEKQARRKGTKPLMTSFSVYNLARNNCFDSTKAMRELGYRTRSYRETMHDEIQWLIETGKVKAPAVKAAVMEPVPAHA
jgi:dihydroflavonol-4-reductase